MSLTGNKVPACDNVRRGVPAFRHIDLIVLAVALPVFLLAGWPLLGWGAGALAWVLQKAIQTWTNRRAEASDEPRQVAGIVTGSMIGRGWLVALIVFGAGMIENDAGLSAAVLFLLVFTLNFSISLVMRPFDRAQSGGTA